VDFICGAGFGPERKAAKLTTGRPALLVTNLGVFVFDEASGSMEIESLHPGVDFETLQANTGFALRRPDTITVTPGPTEEELHWIRERLDPLGMRRLEGTGQANDVFNSATEQETRLWNSRRAQDSFTAARQVPVNAGAECHSRQPVAK
jgi:glutaconate CoA-transferase subunit B